MPSTRHWWLQPRWFRTLFLTDMWERFSFFGMMAILFLYAGASRAQGGLGLSLGNAGALVGLYISATFVAAVPGGWIGDRVLGARRATRDGSLLIAAGHCCLAVPAQAAFYPGIALIVAGTGLIKPNLSALLGASYPAEANSEREAGFSLFFMSIQIPALIAPIVTGYLGEHVNWHLGFGAAALGMAFGVLQFSLRAHVLGEVGLKPGHPADRATLRRVARWSTVCVAVVAIPITISALTGTLRLEYLLAFTGVLVLAVPVFYYRSILRTPAATPEHRSRLRWYAWVFLATTVFFLLFSQGNTVLNLFALRSTDRSLAGFSLPASWFQALHPLFVLVAAPLIARLWTGRGRRWHTPSKMAAGLVLAGLSFLVLTFAAVAASNGPVSPLWLAAVFLLQSCGELVLGTVSMAVTVRIAPPGAASRLMGLWWLAGSVGAAIGGQLARLNTSLGITTPYFLGLFLLPTLLAVVLVALRRRIADGLEPAARPAPPLSRSTI